MERYAIIIRPNEEMALLHCYPGDSLDLKTLQEIVEGHIETVPTALAGEWSHEQGVGLTLIINEEGQAAGDAGEPAGHRHGVPLQRRHRRQRHPDRHDGRGLHRADEGSGGEHRGKVGIKGCGVIETRFIIPPAGASFRAFWRRFSATTRANIRRRLIF